jgi:hypothetical protein
MLRKMFGPKKDEVTEQFIMDLTRNFVAQEHLQVT